MKVLVDGYKDDVVIKYSMQQIYSDSELEKRGYKEGDLVNHKGVVDSVYLYREELLDNGEKKIIKIQFSVDFINDIIKECNKIDKIRQKLPYSELPF